ncbi:LysR family transcriptional regulator [Paremcibacter congregatus]|uniref:LysR family transcriptional regulator n=1 Tax=Paremcibacter congregatus TaxID=2043170 RepID=UPI0030EB31ED|tara:strand:+ start:9213 stop:10124 length:912 start_codon:yes stop_codon:yes gene_type:complete
MGQFEDMDSFVRIVDAGSISQAAQRQGVVKSAMSRRLMDLETRLGVQLLNRTTRTSSLTEAGRLYYDRSVQILAEVAEINAATACSKLSLSGSLKISAPLSFGLQHLSPAITAFATQHPDLGIHMDFNDRQVDLVAEGFDIAIRIANLKDSSLMARKIAPVRLLLCASPAYLARKGTPKEPNDLKQHDILQYSNTDDITWRFISPEGQMQSVNLPAKMTANNGDFLKDAALADQGIILSPTFIVWRDLREGRLVPLLNDHHFPGLSVFAVYPQTRHLPQKVRSLIDFLKDHFGGEPYWDDTMA